MAKMFRTDPVQGTTGPAGIEVFRALKGKLSDDYSVFHSVPLLQRKSKESGLFYVEIDFLITDAGKGDFSLARPVGIHSEDLV